MVTTYGMSEKMGNLAYGKEQEHVFMGRNFGNTRDFSEEIAADIDKEVKIIVDKQYEYAKNLLNDNRDMLEYIAKQLLEKETLDQAEFDALRDYGLEIGFKEVYSGRFVRSSFNAKEIHQNMIDNVTLARRNDETK
jgi:ATP-dependent Zn protease